MTKTCGSEENFIPAMAVYSFPYIFRDSEHYWNVLNSDLGQFLLKQGESKFLRGLCYYDAGARSFYTTEKPIKSSSDLTGMKIRVMSSKTAMDMIKAMGGAPTPIAWGELYSALAQGAETGL